MTPRRGLFVRLLRSTFADFAPLMVIMCVIVFIDDGIAWPTLGEAAQIVGVWLLLSLLWAAWRTRSLVRVARGLGIEVSANALNGTQTHTLTGIPLSRVRAELGVARRASEVGGGNPVGFQWRPFRNRASADGTVTCDESTGEARVEVRAGRRLGTDVVLFRGAAFIALCQIVRTLEGR
ncbi:hypothetical protein [Streptomyces sp. NPDC001980]|uniref:hypothetical protein n=1 Tax=Streptomyces sp. NPDC001980 TaxID=3157126 RepID=UPI00331A6F29